MGILDCCIMKQIAALLTLSLAYSFSALAAETQKVRVDDAETAQRLMAAGATLIGDYGSFSVLEVPTGLPALRNAGPALESIAEQNQILLNTGTIDTRSTVAPERLAALAGTASRLHLVQFGGPVKAEWLEELVATGVRLVCYIPHNAYLVYGPVTGLNSLKALKATRPWLQWEGAYLDDDKIQPRAKPYDAAHQVRALATDTFAIQLVADDAANAATLAMIDALRLSPIARQDAVENYRNVIVRLPADQLAALASQPDVVSINLYNPRRKFDERQDQIVAGNLTGVQPSGPGYLAWLASKGFAQTQFTASGFAVDVTDSGLDNGTATPNHFGLFTGGNTAQTSRVVYSRLEGTGNSGSTIQGCDGHGNLNAHIIGGYVSLSNFPHTDSAGYRYGLGVCPFVKVGSSVIFDPSNFTTPDYEDLISRAYRDGARISSDSWGADTAGDYDVDAQAYDALVRDAQPTASAVPVAGNQEMTIVFAAGNAGSGAQTVGSPGTAKNVITVGAAENVHSHATTNGGNSSIGDDGCTTPDSEANGAGDIASFSSRGPCSDQRRKPEIVAPGTHITGGVGQSIRTMSGNGTALACFDGTGVCGLPGGGTVGSANNFFPLGQRFYSTSSGTSHSTPAVAGGCALIRQYFLNQGWNAPSPAMVKSFLMASARYMTGTSANDSLWSNSQGMGGMNLGMAFDGAPRVLRDQLTNDLFTATGQTRQFPCTVASAATPVRITLGWTDAPGATTGNAYKNNLDLVVVAGGKTYRGNVFNGAWSTNGGSADVRNNAESVFLPAGTTGAIFVAVSAANINSDGIPNFGGTLDQDFALVIYNATAGASNQPPTLAPIGNRTGAISNLLQFTVSAFDAADGDPITLSATNLPAWATFATVTNAGGVMNVFSGTPETAGVFSITFSAGDKDGTNSETVAINITDGSSCGVIISEYIEGSGNNKAIEIFNGTALPLNLAASNYVVQVYANGSSSPQPAITLTGTVAAASVYVVANSTASATLLAYAHQTSANLSHSGNDLVVLRVGGTTGAIVDAFGQIGISTDYAKDTTLVRNPAIITGDVNTSDAFTTATEWISFPADTFTNLGTHVMNCGPAPQTPPGLNSIANQFVVESNALVFGVSANPSDGDTVTLTASNLPAGAFFAATNELGTFTWSVATPAGVYTSQFFATDNDGSTSAVVLITVTASGGGGSSSSTTTLVEYDFNTPAGAFEVTAEFAASGLAASALTTMDGTVTNFGGNPGVSAAETGFVSSNYFEFSVAVMAGAGSQVNISGLRFDDRKSSSGPTEWHVRYSGNGFGADLAAGATHSAFTTNAGAFSLSALAGTNVFRIYGNGASAAGGTWRVDNVKLLGEIVSTNTNLDADGDGLPDAWEMQYFGAVTNADAASDADGDGFIDLHEFLAGTVPTHAGSHLAATAITTQSVGEVVIVWQSASNRSYVLERSFDGLASLAGFASNLPATPPVNVYTDNVATNAAGFYRIRLQP